jgi:archaellum biogenesis ATPase FlaH
VRSELAIVTPSPDPGIPGPGEGILEPPGWLAPEDLRPVIAAVRSGESLTPKPTIGNTDDGRGIHYEGCIVSIVAPAGTGKGWLALATVRDVIQNKGHAVYLDYEETAERRVARLLQMGVRDDQIEDGLTYLRPDRKIQDPAHLDHLIRPDTRLVVIDSVNPALRSQGLKINENDDALEFFDIPKYLTRKGLAVMLLDHAPKSDPDGQLGAVVKMNESDCRIVLKTVEPLGRGRVGRVSMTWRKDRPGYWGEGTSCDMVIRSSGDTVDVMVEAPAADGERYLPTRRMEEVSRVIETTPGIGITELREAVSGRSSITDDARQALVDLGHVEARQEGRRTALHLVRPYAEKVGTDSGNLSRGQDGIGAGDDA